MYSIETLNELTINSKEPGPCMSWLQQCPILNFNFRLQILNFA